MKMNKYNSLINSNAIKRDFYLELIEVLNISDNLITPKQIGTYLHTIQYSDLKNWDVKEIFKNTNHSESSKALLSKVGYMLLHCDFDSIIRMLYSFRNGVKRISHNKGLADDPIQKTIWKIYKDGQEYEPHEKNLPKAHFRWNFVKRYILSIDEINKITVFIDSFYTPIINEKINLLKIITDFNK